MQLISPHRIEKVSWSVFRSRFDECVNQIEDGTIFRVHGHERLQEFFHTIIEPKRASRRFDFFRENPDEIHHEQVLQKVLFSDIKSLNPIFIDSTVRLRRTLGLGALVGPHIDKYESLPVNGINFWISFSSLQREQALQFLPEKWLPKSENSGSFKLGTYIDHRSRLMPSLELTESALSSDMGPCDIFIFNSGRTIHCSPFFVGDERISADQRLFIHRDHDDIDFGFLPEFYRQEDMRAFTGEKAADQVLQTLWQGYAHNFDSSETLLSRDASELRQSNESIALDGFSTYNVIRYSTKTKYRLPAKLVNQLTLKAPRSVAVRIGLLNCNISRKSRRQICLELLQIPPEQCSKTYSAVASNMDTVSLAQFSSAASRSYGSRRAFAAVVLLLFLALIVRFRLRSVSKRIEKRLAQSFSRHLLYLLHRNIFAMEVDIRKFKRAIRYNGRLFSALPFGDKMRRITKTPQFGSRTKSILIALQRLEQNNRRTGNQISQIAEFGVANGEGFRQLVIFTMHYCALHQIPIPYFYGFDTFDGLPTSDNPADAGEWEPGDYPGNIEKLSHFIENNKWNRHCRLVKGLFSKSLPTMPENFSPDFILIDCDYYTSTRDVFEYLKGKLKSGTIVYFDDIDTNFQNRYLGENRLIHELNEGMFGDKFYLYQISHHLYVWSNSEDPVLKKEEKIFNIPLKESAKLGDFF